MTKLFKPHTQDQNELTDEQRLSFIKHQYIVSILLSPDKLRHLNTVLVVQGLQPFKIINESVLQAILSDSKEKTSGVFGEKHRKAVNDFLERNVTLDIPVEGYDDKLKEISQKYPTLTKQLEEEKRLLESETTKPSPKG